MQNRVDVGPNAFVKISAMTINNSQLQRIKVYL